MSNSLGNLLEVHLVLLVQSLEVLSLLSQTKQGVINNFGLHVRVLVVRWIQLLIHGNPRQGQFDLTVNSLRHSYLRRVADLSEGRSALGKGPSHLTCQRVIGHVWLREHSIQYLLSNYYFLYNFFSFSTIRM